MKKEKLGNNGEPIKNYPEPDDLTLEEEKELIDEKIKAEDEEGDTRDWTG